MQRGIRVIEDEGLENAVWLGPSRRFGTLLQIGSTSLVACFVLIFLAAILVSDGQSVVLVLVITVPRGALPLILTVRHIGLLARLVRLCPHALWLPCCHPSHIRSLRACELCRAISDEVLRALEQELDLEAVRAGAGELS